MADILLKGKSSSKNNKKSDERLELLTLSIPPSKHEEFLKILTEFNSAQT